MFGEHFMTTKHAKPNTSKALSNTPKTPTPSVFEARDAEQRKQSATATVQSKDAQGAEHSSPPYRILKHAQCPKLNPRAKGELTYHIGYTEDDQAYHFRIVANGSSGYFSNEWIALQAIQAVLEAQTAKGDGPFKALVLKGLYVRKGANNHGFLAAALRAEKILKPVEGQPLLHTVAEDFHDRFTLAMQALIKQDVDLPDTVAQAHARKAALRAERIAQAEAAARADDTQRKDAKNAPSKSTGGPMAS
jgi:hypothetical protein